MLEEAKLTDYDVVIIGAGPYGLSAAAHLGSIPGLRIGVFGEPMSFWTQHMPRGMLLRSPWAGSHLSDPESRFTLDAYHKTMDESHVEPIPIQRFVAYGCWFQRQMVPDIDRRKVTRVKRDGGRFALVCEDGAVLTSRRVVVACGIEPFARRPEWLSGLPATLIGHTSEHRDLSQFAGKEVLVIGGGQSALESAALMHEGGAQVEVVVRAPVVHWLHQRAWTHRWPVEPLLYAPPDVGPALVSHLVARPAWFRQLPRRWQDRWRPRSLRPAGAAWLKPRVKEAPIATGLSVVSGRQSGGRVDLKLSDGSERRVDYVLLATGYRVDISRYSFLDRSLLIGIEQVAGFPELDGGFETSVPGLHFLGAPAGWSFGPLMWFVAGTEFAARALFRRTLERQSGRPRPVATHV